MSLIDKSPVLYEARDGVGWITLNRPAKLNALSTELAAALAEHAETAAADPRARQVVVRGAGRAFCSGMDRTALAADTIGEAFFRHWNRALDCLEDMPKITIAVLRLARVVGIGRAKELALLNDHVSPAEARGIGLVNWVCAAADLDRTLASIIEKARSAAPTATAHTKRLLHDSFHHDPRALLEDVLRAQADCAASWEMDEANRAWREKREARFDPPER